MTNSTELTMADVEKLVAGFDTNFRVPAQADIEKNDELIRGLHEKLADRTFDMIAALVDLSEALDVDGTAPREGFKAFLKSRGQKAARDGNNPYMPFIKAVYSVELDGKWVFGNRSAEKYANVLRHIVPLVRKGKLTGSIQDYIRGYEHQTYGNGMRGIEAQDRADNPNGPAEKRVVDLRKKGKAATPIANIGQDFGIAANTAVMLRGYVNERGQVEVLEAKALNDDEANSFYYNLGRAA